MFDKRAKALAALHAAELHTGVTPVVNPNGRVGAGGAPGSDSKTNRGTIVTNPKNAEPPTDSPVCAEQYSVRAENSSIAAPAQPVDEPLPQALPVASAVAQLIPGQSIAPGTVLNVIGSKMLEFQLLSAASQAGFWVAIVGDPNLGLVAVAEAGLALERVALVQDPGLQAAAVIAALLEAMCVVVGPEVVLRDSEKRRLAARARERGTVIVSAIPWPGAHLVLRVAGKQWFGAQQGEQFLTHCLLAIERTGRGSAARPQQFEVDLMPMVTGLGAEAG